MPISRLDDNTTLFGDLGIDGDDALEFLEAFAKEFDVDTSSLRVSDHFGPEGIPVTTFFRWIAVAFRRGTPEARAGLQPITIGGLIGAARRGSWSERP